MAPADAGSTRAHADFDQLRQQFEFDGEVAVINHRTGAYRLLGRSPDAGTVQLPSEVNAEDLEDV